MMNRSGVCAPKGFRAAGLHCGIRKNQNKKDLALVMADVPCTAAAVYTTNKVYGAPITVTRAHLADGMARAMLCNSGNANTCNADGVSKATAMCEMLAAAHGIAPNDIIIASTGVIGQSLDLVPIEAGIPSLVANLSEEGGLSAAEAIMTTDLVSKEAVATFEADGVACTVGAMAKGSGMIAPNMATMLCFITTDAAVDAEALNQALHSAVANTLNMLIVDGDTSTNDMACAVARGMAGKKPITLQRAAFG
ncbi:MAG: bifunctional ornithine acetyltransferase/N-acetylglutamate synthase, partial [Clostridia bacterium]|nr:bifunctional ornithine acetyltransferase/N-acetylglutamate synthase [Clostridia bacterium]